MVDLSKFGVGERGQLEPTPKALASEIAKIETVLGSFHERLEKLEAFMKEANTMAQEAFKELTGKGAPAPAPAGKGAAEEDPDEDE